MNIYFWLPNLFRDRRGALKNSLQKLRPKFRLQNSPYFCVFKTREQSNKRSGTRLKTESETGERRFTPVRLLRHVFLISLLILRKYRLFCSLAEIALKSPFIRVNRSPNIWYKFRACAKAIRHSATIASVSRRSQPGFYLKTEASTYLLLYHKAPPSGLYHHAKTMGENGCNAPK